MPFVNGILVGANGAIQADASAPTGSFYRQGTRRNSSGEFYVSTSDPITDYLRGIAHTADGAMRVSTSLPAHFVSGVPLTASGEVCYTDTTSGSDTFQNGLRYAPDGRLIIEGVAPAAAEQLNVDEGTGLEALRVDEGTGFENLQVYA